jgi:hypothetical protein
MRAHGVPDFPDPGANGRIAIQGGPGSDLDPQNPQFRAAQQACQSLQPTGSPAQQAAGRATFLRYSKCMRAHGIADFPDPNSSGGIQIQGGPGSGLDPQSPQFQAADKACQHFLPGGGKGRRTNFVNGGPTSGSQTGGSKLSTGTGGQ